MLSIAGMTPAGNRWARGSLSSGSCCAGSATPSSSTTSLISYSPLSRSFFGAGKHARNRLGVIDFRPARVAISLTYETTRRSRARVAATYMMRRSSSTSPFECGSTPSLHPQSHTTGFSSPLLRWTDMIVSRSPLWRLRCAAPSFSVFSM